jgi:DNA-binding transcriptional regulator YiaG
MRSRAFSIQIAAFVAPFAPSFSSCVSIYIKSFAARSAKSRPLQITDRIDQPRLYHQATSPFGFSLQSLSYRSEVYTAPILGAIYFGLYIKRVTKSVFTARYKLLLSILVSIREDKGLSQRALSEKLKRTPTYVSKYERGERRLDVIEFLNIVKILEADPYEIIRKIIR